MTKEETIAEYLKSFNAETIDDLPDNILVGLISEFYPPRYGGSFDIYKESNEKERSAFISDIKKCLRGEADMEYYLVNNEGVRDEKNEEMFLSEHHSVWYELIQTR